MPSADAEWLPAALTSACTVRTKRPGDIIIPFGRHTPVRLDEYLARRHVDRPFRDHIPLLCRGHEVLLVCGVGTGNIPKEQMDPVFLSWEGDTPWKE